jgi:hypothetical protein
MFKLNIVALNELTLCINSCTKTCFCRKIKMLELGLPEMCHTGMIYTLKSNMPDSYRHTTIIPSFVKIHSGNSELSLRIIINST